MHIIIGLVELILYRRWWYFEDEFFVIDDELAESIISIFFELGVEMGLVFAHIFE